MISHIDVVTVYVEDQDRTVASFTGKLDFEKRTDAEMGLGDGIRHGNARIPKPRTHSIENVTVKRERGAGIRRTVEVRGLQQRKSGARTLRDDLDPAPSRPWGVYRTVTDPKGRSLLITKLDGRPA